MKDIFVAATGQDRGKTSFSVGFLSLLKDKVGNVGYMKPVGNRFITTEDGLRIDEDVKLVDSIYNFEDNLKDVSPVILDSSFVRHCIDADCRQELEQQIMVAYERLKQGRDMLVIEGSGQTSVGEVVNLSNARVAEMLGSKVIILAEGGIGNTVDNVVLNANFLQQFDVEILGVVINKVYKSKIDQIKEKTGRALKQRGLEVLGVLPYESMLTYPSLAHILDNFTDFEPYTQVGKAARHRNISRIVVGAMTPREALKYLKGNELLITGGDREDMIVSALCRTAIHLQSGRGGSVSGIITTGGLKPHSSLIETAENLGILVMGTDEDTYTVASRIKDMTVKLRPNDKEKIDRTKEIVRENINLDKILAGLE